MDTVCSSEEMSVRYQSRPTLMVPLIVILNLSQAGHPRPVTNWISDLVIFCSSNKIRVTDFVVSTTLSWKRTRTFLAKKTGSFKRYEMVVIKKPAPLMHASWWLLNQLDGDSIVCPHYGFVCWWLSHRIFPQSELICQCTGFFVTTWMQWHCNS